MFAVTHAFPQCIQGMQTKLATGKVAHDFLLASGKAVS